MEKRKIFVLVKNFEGVNHDVEVYGTLREAKKEFMEYTGFGFSRGYCDPGSPKYDEKFSETKIFELDAPDFIKAGRKRN